MSKEGLLLDIMLEGGRYYRQLKYTKRGFPEVINGEVLETYDVKDLKRYVEEVCHSLKTRKYNIQFSNQKV